MLSRNVGMQRWQPDKSSIFQVLVSIQGLVLVHEPYYLEPAYLYERENDPRSMAYSEHAFVVSRGHVLRVLTQPVTSFESELRWIYLRPDGGLLPRIIEDAEKAVQGKTISRRGSTRRPAKRAGLKGHMAGTGPLLGALTPVSAHSLQTTLTKLKEIAEKAGLKAKEEA
jgi:ubiquitin-conjugating enzyme E2 O